MQSSITRMLAKLFNTLKNNSALAYTALGMIFLQGTNFLTGLLLARYLSPADFGKFQLLITLVTTTAIVAKMGLDEGFVFFVPKIKKNENNEKLFSTYSILVVLFSSAIIGLIFFLFGEFINDSFLKNIDFSYELKIFVIYLISFVLFTMVNALLRGYEYFNFRAFLVYYLNPLSFLLAIIVLFLSIGSLDLIYIYNFRIVIFFVIGLIGLVYFFYKLKLKEKKNYSKTNYKAFHSFSFALVFLTLIEFLAEQPTLDLVILANLTTAYDIGIYSVNYKIAALLLITYLAFQVIYTSKFSSNVTEGNYVKLLHDYRATKKKMMLISISFFCFLFVAYDFIVPLFGEQYAEGKGIFILLSIGFTFFSTNGLNNIMLIVLNKKKYLAVIDLVFIGMLITLGTILVIRFGPFGMALSNCLLFILFTIVKSIYVKKVIEKI